MSAHLILSCAHIATHSVDSLIIYGRHSHVHTVLTNSSPSTSLHLVQTGRTWSTETCLTDADIWVPNRTPMSPLCLCYRYASYCTARTRLSTALVHVPRLLPHLSCTCPAATHVMSRSTGPTSAFSSVLHLTILPLLHLLRQGHRKHL